MGVLDFIKPKSAIEKASKNLQEPYAQPDVRQGAMDKLFELGTDEAYRVLLKRFTFSAHGHTADESEKRSLVERLVATGEPVVPALKSFISGEKKNITYPIEALRGILSHEENRTFLKGVLQQYEPSDHRSTQAKATLVVALSELLDRAEVEVLVPYLDDHSDDVQFRTIAAIEHLKAKEAGDALMAVCAAEEHAPRIQRRAAQALAALEVNVRPRFDDFAPELKGEYMIDKKGRLQKKTAAGG